MLLERVGKKTELWMVFIDFEKAGAPRCCAHGLVTWRENRGETGYQLAEIWLSQEMLERVDQGKGGRILWRTI